MKVDNETIHNLVLERDIDGLYKACTAMRKELEAKNDLVAHYLAEIDRMKVSAKDFTEKYEVLESERNLLRRVCRRLEVVCSQKDIYEDYQSAWQEYDLTSSGS